MTGPGTERSEVLLQGLSSFWLRLFSDKDTLSSFFGATEQEFSQVYLDILESVLGTSVTRAPVYHKQYWYALFLDSDDKYTDTLSVFSNRWPLQDNLAVAGQLQNTIFTPSVTLVNNIDYNIVLGEDGTYSIGFLVDPFTVAGVPYRYLSGPGSTRRLALWAPDAGIDTFILAENFGYLLNQEQPSSEVYRSFLKGVFQFYMLGAGLKRIEAALNVAIGIPVTEIDNEQVIALTTSTVETTRRTYTLPNGTVRSDLQVGDYLPAFSPLTDAFVVTDYLMDPTWWWGIQIPQALLPNELASRRRITQELVTNTYNSDGLTKYGDIGLFYGCDDDGSVPPAGRPGLRHGFAYTMMDRLLKYNTFEILANKSVVPIDFEQQLISILVASGTPAYLFTYVRPITKSRVSMRATLTA